MRTDSNSVAPLKDKGNTYTDPKDKANVLNRQFQSVFTEDEISLR